MDETLVPLVIQAEHAGHPVVILTNDPAMHRYSSKIDPRLMQLLKNKEVYLLYHQNYTNYGKQIHKLDVDCASDLSKRFETHIFRYE